MAKQIFVLLVVVVFSVSAFGQGRTGGGTRGGTGGGIGNSRGPTTNTNSPFPSAGSNTLNSLPSQTVFFSGKVALDDGTELTEPASVQSICNGQRHTEAYTDSHGNFSFQFGNASTSNSAAFNDASSSTMSSPSAAAQQQRDWRGCQLQAVLAGFTSETIELISRVSNLESADLGRLSLHRLENVEGTSISVTSALAPGGARKELQKGREQEKKQKWEDAQKSLEKAVQIYPKYAVAWFELGRVQIHNHDIASAKNSFQKAVDADPKYVNPYEGLAQIAFQAHEWPQLGEITTKLLALNPVNFPDAYFMNGVSNFYLQKYEAAEKICRTGIRVDGTQNQVPKLHYLLAMVLIQKHEYPEASDQLRQYIGLIKDPTERAEANEQLEQIGKLSAQSSPISEMDKK